MKKFIYKILLFFLIIATIDVAIGWTGDFLQFHANSGEARRINDLTMNDQHDVIILGSSRAHHHYDTPFLSDSLGLDVYNAGYDGNGVVLAYGLLNLIAERYYPKLVLFDVEPAFDINVYEPDNNHLRYISNLKPYYRHNSIGGIIEDISTEEWYKVHSGMIRYNSNLTSIILDYLKDQGDSLKGYDPLMGIYRDDVAVINNDEKLDSFKIDYVEKLILFAKSRGINIAFVASPKLGVTGSSDIQPVINICENNDIPFFDYYADSLFMAHPEWFNEPMHLNEKGARVFSELLIRDISPLCGIE